MEPPAGVRYRSAMPSLRTKEVDGALRHVLEERPVHAGNVLEFYSMGEGVWLRGRYEWSGTPGDQVWFHTHSGRDIPLSEASILRWPT